MWLEVLSGVDAGRAVEVTGTAERPFVLGRVEGSDLVVRDARASRRHAALAPAPGGGLRLEDLGSANGTRVDGAPVREAVLHGGETLDVGGVRIAVLAQPPPAPGTDRGRRAPDAPSRTGALLGGADRAPLLVVAGLVLGAVAVVLALTGLRTAREPSPDVVRALAPATVLVEARRGDESTGSGSGWLAEPGLVVTAAHVVNQGSSFVVSSASQARAASVLAAAPCEDLAVLQAPGWQGEAELDLGDEADAEQGETVIALGYPAGSGRSDQASSTRGVISAVRTALRDPAPDVPYYAEAVRTDTALDPGFSGGPLVDLDRNVIGVNAAARRTGEDGRVLLAANYAVAAERARRVLDDLRRGRSRAWIGANFGYPTPVELATQRLPEGLFLLGAVSGSPAALARLGGNGEMLTAVNGRAVGRTLTGWCAATRGIASGERAEITLRMPGGNVRRVRLRFA